jgi:hypothetical protein
MTYLEMKNKALGVLSIFIKLGKYHFYTMSEELFIMGQITIQAKISKSQKWDGKPGALKCKCFLVGW